MLRHAAPDPWQHRDELREPMRLARLPYFLPIGMIAILQAPRRVASGGLQVCVRIIGKANILIGGRHSQRFQPRDRPGIADGAAVRSDKREAGATFDPPDRQRRRIAKSQAVLSRQFDDSNRPGLGASVFKLSVSR